MLTSRSRGRRIDSQWVNCFLHILIPFRFLRDRREKWDGGTKKWDQKVGPIVILIFIYVYLPFTIVGSFYGRGHKTLAYGARGSRIESCFSLFFPFTFRLSKIVYARLDFREDTPRLSYPFLHKQTTHFRVVGFAWGEMTIIHA